MKKAQIIGVVLFATGIGAVIYFGFVMKFADGLTGFQKLTKKKLKEEQTKTPPDAAGTGTGKPTQQDTDTSFPIKKGDYGKNVKAIQDSLRNNFNELRIKSDSDFGNKTADALQRAGYGASIDKTDFDNIIAGRKKIKKTSLPKDEVKTGSGIKKGAIVYASSDTAVYTKPIVNFSKYGKTNFMKFDEIGVYMGDSSESGWGKVYLALFDADFFVPYKALTITKI